VGLTPSWCAWCLGLLSLAPLAPVCADHRWQWQAFWAGASPAVYVFLYAVYYFVFRTE